jgi:hypothetical protein
MTMIRSSLAAAAAGVLALCTGSARADDVVRLNGTGDAPTLTLGYDGQSDTELVRRGFGGGGFHGGHRGFVHHHGFHHHGFHRAHHHGFHRAHHHGFHHHGFHRAHHHGFHHHGFHRAHWGRGWGGWGWGRGWGWGGGLYAGYSGYPGYGVYGYEYPIYGGYAPYYNGGYGGYCYPMSASVAIISPSTGADSYAYPGVPDMPPAGTQAGPQPGDGYSYDGVPSNSVPMPGAAQPGPAQPAPVQPAPAKGPRRVVPQPAQGLLVSIPGSPRPAAGLAYPAYGEDNRASSFTTDRTRRTTGR